MKGNILFCLAFLIAGCCDDDNPSKPLKKTTMLVAGEPVEFNYSTLAGSNDQSVSLYMTTFSAEGYLRKEFWLNYFSLNPGKSIINGTTLGTDYTTYQSHGDVVGNIYNLDKTDAVQDYVSVLAFSPETRIATIELQASYFVIPEMKADPSLPDSLVIGRSILTIDLNE